jgi:hypothetical protein
MDRWLKTGSSEITKRQDVASTCDMGAKEHQKKSKYDDS